MKTGIGSDTANQAKTLAQQIAKQMAGEPLEVLKDVKEQTTGDRLEDREETNSPATFEERQKQQGRQNELADKQKSSRFIEALNRELDDIRKQKLFKELQARISNGEEIPLEDYPELTMEQKQVLLAHMEAVKAQKAAQEATSFKEVPVIHSKPSRRFGAGQKSQAQKEQTRVEKPIPPSG